MRMANLKVEIFKREVEDDINMKGLSKHDIIIKGLNKHDIVMEGLNTV